MKILNGFDYRQIPRYGKAMQSVAASAALDESCLEMKAKSKRNNWTGWNETS